jgi:hypothetical protein
MLDETIRVLAAADFTRGQGQADRKAIGRAFAKYLWDEARVHEPDEDEVQQSARTVPEIRINNIGSSDNDEVNGELDDLARALLPGDGLVQRQLDEIAALMGENGERVVLCAARITRDVSNNGVVTGSMKVNGRFVSSHPDVIERYYLAPGEERAVNAAASYRGRVTLAGDRVPALGTPEKRAALLGGVHKRVTAELTDGAAA